ncbi:MAG: phospholipase D-like domain-containing protein [Mycoplasmataceae bacterium]|nr:phospholipase D-like domain-containing protein [Mycoplasmataceae bacterium]
MKNTWKTFINSIITLFLALIIIVISLLITYASNTIVLLCIIFFTLSLNISFGIFILNSKNRLVETRASWIFFISSVPLIGVLIFLIFGTKSFKNKKWEENDLLEKKFLKYENYEFTNKLINSKNIDDEIGMVFNCIYLNQLKPVYEFNKYEVIKSNEMIFSEYINLIRSAKKHIHLQVYLIKDGVFIFLLISELIKKAKEGIKIRFLYDWVGSFKKFNRKYLTVMKKNNIEVAQFNPSGINMFKGSTNYRSHKKTLIVDNTTALYTSANISDEYIALSTKDNYWRDLNIKIHGEIVNSLNINFCIDWYDFTKNSLSDINKKKLINSLNEILIIDTNTNEKNISQLITCTPNFDNELSILSTTTILFISAKEEIIIVTPYLVLPNELISALVIALSKKIKVKIIVPGRRDNKDFVIPMNRDCYIKLLKYGCEVYEYDGFIHSKYIIVDNKYVQIGSNNMDFRSFFINFENCIFIKSESVSNSIKKIFEIDLQNTKLMEYKYVDKYLSKLRIKILIWFLNIYKPLL